MNLAFAALKDFERRFHSPGKLELRTSEAGVATIGGYAAVFDQLSVELGGPGYSFREKIGRHAFDETLQRDDQLAYWNHNGDIILGRRTATTLRLATDDHGLAFELDLPDTSGGRDARVSIERGDVREMSFGFRILSREDHELVEEDGAGGAIVVTRTLKKVMLLEVSPVGRAAYPQTDVALRSIDAWRAERARLAPKAAPANAALAEMRRRQLLAEIS